MSEPRPAGCVPMSSEALTPRLSGQPLRSKRLLALAGDERIVEQIRRGNELAFEIAFERHGAGILAFCRHMLGSREEAEDAVQHTFAAAFRDLARDSDRKIVLRPWLYTIARNRCLSLLRARREEAKLDELPTEGLSDEVERRAELRELLADVRELPEDQRAALLLAEAAGMSHAEVAQVLDCEPGSVKGLVFRARSSLIERRDARETPCGEIREQLANLRGGALRRGREGGDCGRAGHRRRGRRTGGGGWLRGEASGSRGGAGGGPRRRGGRTEERGGRDRGRAHQRRAKPRPPWNRAPLRALARARAEGPREHRNGACAGREAGSERRPRRRADQTRREGSVGPARQRRAAHEGARRASRAARGEGGARTAGRADGAGPGEPADRCPRPGDSP